MSPKVACGCESIENPTKRLEKKTHTLDICIFDSSIVDPGAFASCHAHTKKKAIKNQGGTALIALCRIKD